MGAAKLNVKAQRALRGQTRGAQSPRFTQETSIPYANTIGRNASAQSFRWALIIGTLIISLSLLTALHKTLTFILLAFTVLICLQAILRLLAIVSSKSRFDIPTDTKPNTPRRTQDWPFYTVLVPLKDEAHMVDGLINTLSKLEYPRERLQIIFITEEDDPKTRRAVTSALQSPFEQVVVPRRGETGPRTKPHALNIAMRYARGEIVTIYDAEDAPHPQQLKTAVRAFERHPNWGALQAPLDYFNTGDSWLAAQFGLEYAAQFHVWIPLMVRVGLPFPLGGTSNHIRRSALNSISNKNSIRHKEMFWDSHNVTEDADLSFRLSASGWDIGYITPPTQEEAVSRMRPWTHQRTRWMKGFMQSWRVHMDKPLAPGGWRGVRRQITLQLTLGSVLLAGFLHAPICLGLLLWMGYNGMTQGGVSVTPLMYVSLAAGYGSGLLIGAVGAVRAGKPQLLLSLPLMPLYWLCLAWPTYRAAEEYVKRPYYWAKTTHGACAQPPFEDAEISSEIILPLVTAEPNWPSKPRIRRPHKTLRPDTIQPLGPANDTTKTEVSIPKAAE